VRLLRLAHRSRSVVAPGDRQDCEILRFLAERPANQQKSAKGFASLFRLYADKGRQGLTSEQFHLANREHKIYEFIKGSLRIYCFEDGSDGLILLTHGIVKKRNTTKRADVERAVNTRNEYMQAKQASAIEVQETAE